MNLFKKTTLFMLTVLSVSTFAPVTQVVNAETTHGKIQKALKSQSNIFNSKVPASQRQALEKFAGYNEQMQVLLTYSILKADYGKTDKNGYASIYANGDSGTSDTKELIDDFNKQNVGYTVGSNIGNKSVLKAMAKLKYDQMSKSDQVTSTTPNGENKKQQKDSNYDSVSHAIAKELADNYWTAAKNSATPEFINYNTSITEKAANVIPNVAKLFGNKTMKFSGKIGAAYNTRVNFDPDEQTDPSTDLSKHYPSGKISAPSSVVSMFQKQINQHFIKDAGSISKSESKLNSLTAEQVIQSMDNRSSNSNTDDVSDLLQTSNVRAFDTGSGFKGLINLNEGNKDKLNRNEINKRISELKSQAVNPFAMSRVNNSYPNGHYQTSPKAFNHHYSYWMNKKTTKKLSKDQLKKLKSGLVKQNNDAKQTINENKGSTILGWNWVGPYSERYNKGHNKVGTLYANNKQLFYTKRSDLVAISPAALVEDGSSPTKDEFKTKGTFFDKNVFTLIDGDTQQKGITVGDTNNRIDLLNHKNQIKNKIVNGYQNLFDNKKLGDLKANNDIVGYDAYGNLINGQTGPTVIIPYWQNWTIVSFGLPKITVNPALNGSNKTVFGYGGGGEFSDAKSKVRSMKGTNAQIADFAGAISSSSTKSPSNYIAWLNKQAGSSGSSKLSDKTAAKLAVVITALTKDKVSSFNKKFLSASEKNSQLYIGKSANYHKNTGSGGKGTYLYTATDIIQRAGLQSDYGFFDSIRKTIVAALVNAYNNGFIKSGQQNIFYTTTSADTGFFSALGLLPYYLIVFFVGIVFLWILFQQVVLKNRNFRHSKYLTTILKIVALMLIVTLNPMVDNLLLNKPGEILINKSLKEQSVLDRWSDIRQQEAQNNVLYSGLFGDTFGQINNSSSYAIKFYTTTPSTKGAPGSIDNDTQKVNTKLTQQQNNGGNNDTNTAQQRAMLHGNGKVSMITPYRYKTVSVAMSDLLSWAMHMNNQIKTYQQMNGIVNKNTGVVPSGFSKDSSRYEEPNAKPDGTKYAPGAEPLFHWLANNYKPLSDKQGTGGDSKQYGTIASGASYGSGDSAYGKRRNPADTSLKSAYRTNASNNSDTNNNEAAYKDLGKYTEFAVNTKHYAMDIDKAYGIDSDSNNKADTSEADNQSTDSSKNGTTMLTASELFLRIWETTFSTVGTTTADQLNGGSGASSSDQTTGVENYDALMKFAEVLRNSALEGDVENNQQNSSSTNSNSSSLTLSQIGNVGKKDLINEVSMTKAQRQALNGGDGNFSQAAKDVMAAAKISAPTNDWLNLSAANSPLDVLHPYYGKKQNQTRDGLIFKINKKFLTDYINTYSIVRQEIDPTGSDSSGNNNDGDEDSFSMAEAQVMAVDLFFTINHYTHQRVFPTRFTPSSISLDSWNRMLLIPIGEMKSKVDNSQYNIWNDNENASAVALQDNVAEYIGINSTIFALTSFIVMNILLIVFGEMLSFFVSIVMPILLFFSILRIFFKGRAKFSSIVYGALFCKIIISVMKVILISSYAFMSNQMNNSYINNGGNIPLPVLKNTMIISLEIILFIIFFVKCYIPSLKGDLLGLGATGGFSNLFNNVRANTRATAQNSWLNRGLRNGVGSARNALRLHNLGNGIRTIVGKTKKGLSPTNIMAIASHVRNIKRNTGRRSRYAINVIKDIKSRSLRENIDTFKDALIIHSQRSKHKLSDRLNNLVNAQYGRTEATFANGVTADKLNSAADGDLLNTIDNQGQVNYRLNDDFNHQEIERLKNAFANSGNKIHIRHSDQGDFLSFDNVSRNLIGDGSTVANRKEVFGPAYETMKHILADNSRFAEIAATRPLPQNFGQLYDNKMSFDIGKEIMPTSVNNMIRELEQNGFKLANTLKQDANGNYLYGQQLQFVPNNRQTNSQLNNMFNRQVQDIAQKYAVGKLGQIAQDYGTNLGTEALAKKVAAKIPGAKVIGDQVLVNRNNRQAVNSLQNAIADINRDRNNEQQTYQRMAQALGDTVLGNGGLSNLAYAKTNTTPISQFKTSNAKNASDMLNALASVAKSNQFAQMGNLPIETQRHVIDSLHQQNPLNVAQQMYDGILSNRIQQDNQTRQALQNLIKTKNNVGATGFNQLSKQQKADLHNQLDSAIEGLKKQGSWNIIQKHLAEKTDDNNFRSASNKDIQVRSNLLSMIGKTNNKAAQILQNYDNESLVSFIGSSSRLKASVNDKVPNVLNIKGEINNSRQAQRLSKLIREA